MAGYFNEEILVAGSELTTFQPKYCGYKTSICMKVYCQA